MDINRLHFLLKEKGITQKEIAQRVGLSANAISKAFKKGDFKISMLEKIAEVLDVPTGYFFENCNNGINQVSNGSQNKQTIINGQANEIAVLEERIKGLKKQIANLEKTVEKHEKWEEDYKSHVNMLEDLFADCKTKLAKYEKE